MSRPEAPYLRIVEEIRRRIAAAELRPGDQVPSARRISQEWGVAIATATKVHAALRQQGLTEARPGVGTVVGKRPGARACPGGRTRPTAPRRGAAGRRGRASRERIVAVAIAVADADGMAELSMRRVATELGVATMSLYRYVASKDELLLHMIDTVLGEEEVPPRSKEGWRADLAEIARLEWRFFRRHPWLAPAMSITRTQLTPNTVAITDGVLNALDGLGLDSETELYVHLTLFSFGQGWRWRSSRRSRRSATPASPTTSG